MVAAANGGSAGIPVIVQALTLGSHRFPDERLDLVNGGAALGEPTERFSRVLGPTPTRCERDSAGRFTTASLIATKHYVADSIRFLRPIPR